MGKKGKGKGKGKGKAIAVPASEPAPVVPPEPVFDRKLPVFSFSLMVWRLNVTGVALIDPRQLVVLVNFGGFNFSLTAKRTDISRFRSSANWSFQKDCKELTQILEEAGLSFEVLYEDEKVGVGQVLLPTTLTSTINLDMTEFSYTASCPLELDRKPTGKLEFLCKLFIKCGDYARDGENCRNLNRNINPDDIVFVLGKSQANTSSCDPCRDALEIEAKKEKDYVIQTNPGSR